jgi:hypothetical protein
MNSRKVLEEEYKLGVCITLRLIPKSRRATPNVQAVNDEPNYLKQCKREVSESVRSVTAKTFDREKPDGAGTVEEAEVGDYDGVIEGEVVFVRFGGGGEEEGG